MQFDIEDAKRYPSQTTGTYRAKRSAAPKRTRRSFLGLSRKAQAAAAVMAFLIVMTQQIHAANASGRDVSYENEKSSHVDRSGEEEVADDGEEPVTRTTRQTTSCIGVSAFSYVNVRVNGQSVGEWSGSNENFWPAIANRVQSKSEVRILYKVKPECDNVPVSLVAYESNADSYNKWNQGKTLRAWASDRRDGGDDVRSLSVTVPNCYFQLNFATSEVLRYIDTQNNYGKKSVGMLIGGNSCRAVTEPVVETERVVVKPKVVKQDEVCPQEIADRISGYAVDVERPDGSIVRNLDGLTGNVVPGSNVTVRFTLAAGCNERLSLVSYEANSTSTANEDLRAQKLFRWASDTFGPGEHELKVTVPNCFFQIDFVSGNVIKNLANGRADSIYGDRLIDSDIGGAACKTVTKVTTTPKTEVKETVVVKEQVNTAPEVQRYTPPAELAATGFDLFPLFATGTILVSIGLLLLGVASLWRRHSYWYVW